MRVTYRERAIGRRALIAGVAGTWLAGCASQKNLTEFATRLAPAPKGVALDPPPPAGVYWLRIAAARIPDRRPTGEPWNEADLPDPSAVLTVDGEVLLETPAVANTLAPAWTGSPGGNFALAGSSQLEIRLRDNDALTHKPIGEGRFRAPTIADLAKGSIRVTIGKVGAKGNVTIAVDEAHALIGLGFDYEIFDSKVVVSRVLAHSPAGRAGMKVEDEIISVGGVRFGKLRSREVRGAFNGIEKPVEVIVRHTGGTTENFQLGQGPCYPLFSEYGPVA